MLETWWTGVCSAMCVCVTTYRSLKLCFDVARSRKMESREKKLFLSQLLWWCIVLNYPQGVSRVWYDFENTTGPLCQIASIDVIQDWELCSGSCTGWHSWWGYSLWSFLVRRFKTESLVNFTLPFPLILHVGVFGDTLFLLFSLMISLFFNGAPGYCLYITHPH